MTETEGRYRKLLREPALKTISAHDIPGRTPDEDVDTLISLILNCDAKNILELGTMHGFSAVVMADIVAQRHPDAFVLTIDNQPSRIALRRIEESGLSSTIEYLIGNSLDSALVETLLSLNSWDVIYIDTLHNYDHNKRELLTYSSLVAKEHTKIILHDASTFAQSLDTTKMGGVKRAVREFLNEHPDWQGFIFEQPQFPNQYGIAVLSKRVKYGATDHYGTVKNLQ